jgi:hypothetical protein
MRRRGQFTADELVRKLAALMAEEGLLRAMWEVGYYPPDTPPPVMIAIRALPQQRDL